MSRRKRSSDGTRRARGLTPKRRFCERSDVDVPSIRCGGPLPCMRHTYVIDLGAGGAVTVPVGETGAALARLKQIASALTSPPRALRAGAKRRQKRTTR